MFPLHFLQFSTVFDWCSFSTCHLSLISLRPFLLQWFQGARQQNKFHINKWYLIFFLSSFFFCLIAAYLARFSGVLCRPAYSTLSSICQMTRAGSGLENPEPVLVNVPILSASSSPRCTGSRPAKESSNTLPVGKQNDLYLWKIFKGNSNSRCC